MLALITNGAGEKGAIDMLVATHTGMTTEAFSTTMRDWITTAKHPMTSSFTQPWAISP
jgi:hypothetical protein